jgi:Matrixin
MARIGVALALLAGCNTLDVTRPIAIVVGREMNATDTAVVAEAAGCWNQQFGTQVRMVGDHAPEQTIQVEYNEFVCATGGARTDVNLPVRISVCPIRYLQPLTELTSRSYLFMVLNHEFGHALNIFPHASDPHAVMYATYNKVPNGFSDEDCRLFASANPAAPPPARCGDAWFFHTFDVPFCACAECAFDKTFLDGTHLHCSPAFVCARSGDFYRECTLGPVTFVLERDAGALAPEHLAFNCRSDEPQCAGRIRDYEIACAP